MAGLDKESAIPPGADDAPPSPAIPRKPLEQRSPKQEYQRSPKQESQRLKEARKQLRRSHDGLDTPKRNGSAGASGTAGAGGGTGGRRRTDVASRSGSRSNSSRSTRSRSSDSSRRSRSRSSSPSPSRSGSRSPRRRRVARSRSSSYERERARNRGRTRDRRRTRRRRDSRRRSRSPSRSRSRSNSRSRASSHSRSRSWSRSNSNSRSPYRGRARTRRRTRSRSRSNSYDRHRKRARHSRSRSHSRERQRGQREERTNYSRSPRDGYPRNSHSHRHDYRERGRPRSRSRSRSRSPQYYQRRNDFHRRIPGPSPTSALPQANRSPEPVTVGERDVRTVFVHRLVQKVRREDVAEFFNRAGRVKDVRLIEDRRSGRHKGAGYVEFYNVVAAKAAVALSGGLICGFPVAVKQSADENSRSGPDFALGMGLGPTMYNTHAQAPDRNHASALPPPVPLTSAVGWSTRKPVRQVPSTSNKQTRPTNLPEGRVANPKELLSLLDPYNMGAAGSRPDPSTAQGNQPPPNSSNGIGSSGFKRLHIASVPFQLGEAELNPIFTPFGQIASLQLQRDASTGRSRGYGFVEYKTHESARRALSINGIEVAGRHLRVSVAGGMAEASAGGVGGADVAGELDEGREGVVMSESQKAQLRERLARGADLGPALAPNGRPWSQPLQSTHVPFKALMLSNMFDLTAETAGFENDLAEDVREECNEKYGKVTHLHVDANSRGIVYVRFDKLESAKKAFFALNGRWFGGLRVSAAYISDRVYKQRFTGIV